MFRRSTLVAVFVLFSSWMTVGLAAPHTPQASPQSSGSVAATHTVAQSGPTPIAPPPATSAPAPNVGPTPGQLPSSAPTPAAPSATPPDKATIPHAPELKPGELLDTTVHTFTLEAALARALAENTNLKVAQMQQTEAWWAYKVGVSLPSGQLTVNNLGGNNPNATMNGINSDNYITYTQNFGSFRQIALTGKSAYQGYLISTANLRLARVALVQQVKDAFYGVLTAQLQVNVANDNLALTDRVLDLAKRRQTQPDTPRIDLLNARIQQASAQQAYIQAVTTLKVAQDTIAPLLALPARETVSVEGDARLPSLPLVLATLDEMALANSPQVEVARRTLDQSETQVKLTRAQALPSPSLSYSYDLHSTPFYWVGANLSIPLDWGQIKYAVRQQLAAVQEKKLALQSARFSVSSAVKMAFDNYKTTLVNIETFRATVLEPSETLMNETQTEYEKGKAPFVQVLNAQSALRQARTQYYQLLLSGHQALDALEAALGRESGEVAP